jgi:hypothetical protein
MQPCRHSARQNDDIMAVRAEVVSHASTGDLERQFEVEAFGALQVTNDFEQIPSLRVAFRAKHPHQALRWPPRQATQFLKTDSRIDVIAQYRLSGVEIPAEQTLDAFSEEFLAVPSISRDARLYGVLELSCQTHNHFSRDLRTL